MKKIIVSLYVLLLLVSSCKRSEENIVERLMTFTKTYNYARYFYPSVHLDNFDWDAFAIYGAHEIQNIQERKLSHKLICLFRDIGPDFQFSEAPQIGHADTLLDEFSKPIFWMHKGDGNGGVGLYYGSALTNHPAKVFPESTNDYGWINTTMPIDEIKGSKIRISISFKALPLMHARVYLFSSLISQDEGSAKLTTDGQKISEDQWTIHTLEINIPNDIQKISSGVEIIGHRGGILLKDIKIEKWENNGWVSITDILPSLVGNDFETRSEWNPGGPNFEHNAVLEGTDTLIRIERSKGKLVNNYPNLFATPTTLPKFLIKQVGDNIFCKFPLVIYPSVETSKTSSVRNEFIKSIHDILAKDTDHLSLDKRLADIIILYGKFQHFYPYLKEIDINWDDHVKSIFKKVLHDQTLEDHRNTLLQMIHPLNDSHMGVYHDSDVANEYYPPIELVRSNQDLYISNVLDSALAYLKGGKLETINGVPVNELFLEQLGLAPGATATRKNYIASLFLLKGPQDSSVIFTVKKNNDILTKKLLRTFQRDRYRKALQLINPSVDWHGNYVYINIATCSFEEFESKLPKIQASEGIIIDVRGYPKWGMTQILSHFTRDTLYSLRTQIPLYLKPDQEGMRLSSYSQDTIVPNFPYLNIKRVFLTNAKAVSNSETFLSYVSHYKLGKIMGEITAGSSGYTNMVLLPTGFKIPWSGMVVNKQDGSQFQGVGIIPDIEIDPENLNSNDAIVDLAILEMEHEHFH